VAPRPVSGMTVAGVPPGAVSTRKRLSKPILGWVEEKNAGREPEN
jgi:hypothetical protein